MNTENDGDNILNRTKYAIKNASFGILSKTVSLLFSFVSRTAFIYVLGSTYLGVNGLFSEVLRLLSVAELGFGVAMTYSMYKPVADNNRIKVVKLLNFYKKVYRIIAVVVLMLGLCLLPFLRYIVSDAEWLTTKELQGYFLIYLFNTVVGYFVTYKYIYLNALQKNYITTNIDTIVTTVSYISQIIVILIFNSFIGYLLINSLVLLISRIFIVLYLNKKYPILKETAEAPLTKEEKQPIYNEVKGLAVHQFASAAVHSTDNLLISCIISVITVGFVSNYIMIINSVLGFVTILFNSVSSGFGNLVAEGDVSKYRKVFKEINFANFWIYGFCCIAFWILIPPFITLWIGGDKLIDSASFTLIIINCYLQGQSTAYSNARVAKGNFNLDKWWAVIQAVVNLVVSIVAAYCWGLVGIYIGTIASRLVYVLFRTYSTYRFLFEESPKEYYKCLLKYFLMIILTAIFTKLLVNCIMREITVFNFLISAMVVAIVPNIFFVLMNFKSKEMLMWKNRLKNLRRGQKNG